MTLYFLFVTGNGTSPTGNGQYLSGVSIKAAIATDDYQAHVHSRKEWIDKGYNVSTKTKEISSEDWSSVSDIY